LSARQSLATIQTATKFVHRREKFDATAMVEFVARGNEPTSDETGPSDYDKKNRQRGVGDEYNSCFVVVNLCSE
jgi:hypothetical protein